MHFWASGTLVKLYETISFSQDLIQTRRSFYTCCKLILSRIIKGSRSGNTIAYCVASMDVICESCDLRAVDFKVNGTLSLDGTTWPCLWEVCRACLIDLLRTLTAIADIVCGIYTVCQFLYFWNAARIITINFWALTPYKDHPILPSMAMSRP